MKNAIIPSENQDAATTGHSSALARAAFVSAILSYLCLWGLGGFIAVVLGVVAHAETSHTGRAGRLALASIILGGLNVIVAVTLLAFAINRLAAATASQTPMPAVPAPTTPAPPGARAPWAAAPPPRPAPSASIDRATVVTELGRIVLVDVPGEIPSLNSELSRQRAEAEREGQRVLLWLIAPDCQPCNGVAAALADARMQKALAGVRLVRLDILEHAFDLNRLNLPTEKIPGFVLLTARNRPLDYVHGGEWDEDISENIAPVLGQFLRGRYTHRRDPWRGGRRDDETPIGYFW